MLRRLWMPILVVALSAPVAAQTPATASPSPEPTANLPQPDLGRSLVEGELAPLPGGYSYSSQGRRDPFVSLLKPVESNPGSKTRPPGIQGFLIQEVALKGIDKGPKR
jgi:hypothetical protein